MDGTAPAAPALPQAQHRAVTAGASPKEWNALARTRRCSGSVMTQTPHRELLRYVHIHWQRWQCFVARRYHQRVSLPVQFWVALGRPEQFRPQLPWWRPFVFSYLVTTGWLRPSRRRERPV